MQGRPSGGRAAPLLLLLALSWCAADTHVDSAGSSPGGYVGPGSSWFHTYSLPCDPGCTERGNCNGETGQCECPFGLTGPTCSQRLLPACHVSDNSSGLPHYGLHYPKNCECYRQLCELGCTKEDVNAELGVGLPRKEWATWYLYGPLLEWNLRCYTYEGVAREQQRSLPPQPYQAGVSWWLIEHLTEGRMLRRAALTPSLARKLPPAERPNATAPLPDNATASERGHPQELLRLEDNTSWLPLDLCPDRCNERGWCVMWYEGENAGPDPRCVCHGFWAGPACQHGQEWGCYRNCSGVGHCIEGWCHCPPGRWGPGCTRDTAYNSTVGWRPHPTQLRIYVYSLPTHIAARVPGSDWPPLIDPMYEAEMAFTESLLGDDVTMTQNPWEANLFLVPGWTSWAAGNAGSPAPLMARMVLWLQQHSPFWNASMGRNHVWFASGDRAGCFVYVRGSSLNIQRPIMLVHFGQATRTPYAVMPPHSNATSPSLPCEGGPDVGGGLDDGAQSEAAQRHVYRSHARQASYGHAHAHVASALRANFSREDVATMEEQCYRPEKDIVAPTTAHHAVVRTARQATYRYVPRPGGLLVAERLPGLPPRNVTLFFAGSVRPQQSYSQGVRQAVAAMFGPGGLHDPKGPHARPDVFIPKGIFVHPPDEMRRANFCLAVTGYGWGIRLTEALMSGCVPAIVQDHTYQPLWDVLPYDEFSLRIPRRDLPRLMDILDSVTPLELERLQAGVDRWHRAFVWQRSDIEPGVGLAYNYTLLALRQRLLSFRSDNY